jgi:hypothetical protein
LIDYPVLCGLYLLKVLPDTNLSPYDKTRKSTPGGCEIGILAVHGVYNFPVNKMNLTLN